MSSKKHLRPSIIPRTSLSPVPINSDPKADLLAMVSSDLGATITEIKASITRVMQIHGQIANKMGVDPRRIAEYEGVDDDETLNFQIDVIENLKIIYSKIIEVLMNSLPDAISKASKTLSTFKEGLEGLKIDAIPRYVDDNKHELVTSLEELAVCFEFASHDQKNEIRSLWDSLTADRESFKSAVLARLNLHNSPLDKVMRGENNLNIHQFFIDAAE